MLAVAFTGESNSGKTTLIEKLVRLIKSQNPKAKICVIKHDPKDKAQIDNKGYLTSIPADYVTENELSTSLNSNFRDK